MNEAMSMSETKTMIETGIENEAIRIDRMKLGESN